MSPVARIVLAIAIGVVALLVPACGGGGADGGMVNRANSIDGTAPTLP